MTNTDHTMHRVIRPIRIRAFIRGAALGATLLSTHIAAMAQCSGGWQPLTAFNWRQTAAITTFLGPMFVSPVDGSLQFVAGVTDPFTHAETIGVWRLDGLSWQVVATGGLTYRTSVRGVFDEARGRLVVFGGGATGDMDDTWEWDGIAWTEVNLTGVRPLARSRHSMAYDPLRQRIVLQGGRNHSTLLQDTWEWDGSSWILKSAVFPNSRYDAAMAFDPVSQRVILHGGSPQSCANSCTYAWMGEAWELAATGGPGTNSSVPCSMTVDPARGRVLLFAGTGDGSASNTYEWTGTAWSWLSSTGPTYRFDAAMCFDPARGEVVLAGGRYGSFDGAVDIWSWNGTAWTESQHFENIKDSASAADPLRRRVVEFGGTRPQGGFATAVNTMREWDGEAWRNVPAVGPSPRSRAALAWHAGLGQLVLFGGFDGSNQPVADTWLFDGQQWSRLVIPGPSARGGHTMTWDALHDRILLFGGSNSVSTLQDTWEFDGSSWYQVASIGPTFAPKGMAYDAAAERIILSTGVGSADPSTTETWMWDGAVWERLQLPQNPAYAAGPLAWDPVTARVLMRALPINRIERGVFELTSRGWRQTTSVGQSYDLPDIPTRPVLFSHDPASGRLISNFTVSTGAGVPYENSLAMTAQLIRPAIISPDVIEQPAPVNANHNAAVTLSVRASGTAPFAFQWRRNQTPLQDGPRVSGAASDTLRISPADASDSGEYDCVVSNECDAIESFAATVSVLCASDFNLDGGTDGADVEAFFLAWEAAEAPADINADGGIDGADVESFFVRWEAGC